MVWELDANKSLAKKVALPDINFASLNKFPNQTFHLIINKKNLER